MKTNWIRTRQTKYAAYVTMYIAIVIAVIAVANVLANRYHKSYDGTSKKKYSLSDQTAKIVKGLKDDLNITYYDQSKEFTRARDLLDQYSNLSSKVHIQYVDVDKNRMQAIQEGVKSYGTTVVRVGAKKDDAKALTEEGVTGAIIRDLKGNTRNVCFVSGSGEHMVEDSDRNGLSRLKDLLAKDGYTAKTINLLQKAELPSDCSVAVVAGPTGDYAQPAVDAIKTFVENGGRALFLLDPPLKMGHSEIADNMPLTNLLASWGVTLDSDLILDLNPIGQLAGIGPQVALVTSYGSHPIVAEMKGSATGFPISRSMTVKNGDKTTVEKLLDTSSTSLATTNLSSPSVDPNDPKNKKGPLTIAAAGSYKTGKPNSQGRFVVIGSSNWAANSFIGFNGNRDLALNTMNWLASDEDLISIRPKEQDDQRITMTRAQISAVAWTSVALLPLAVVIAGTAVWWRRR